jgi:hypothetical protein
MVKKDPTFQWMGKNLDLSFGYVRKALLNSSKESLLKWRHMKFHDLQACVSSIAEIHLHIKWGVTLAKVIVSLDFWTTQALDLSKFSSLFQFSDSLRCSGIGVH